MANPIREAWCRQGDRITIAVLLALCLGTGLFIRDRVLRIDYSEPGNIAIATQRMIEASEPFPVSRDLAPGNRSIDLDAMLVMDISGSMDTNDKDRLAYTSARMFTDLLGRNSSLGIILFSDGIKYEAQPQNLGFDPSGAKASIKNELKLPYKGDTRIDLALTRAMQILDRRPGKRKVILLMSDADKTMKTDLLAAGKYRNAFADKDIRIFPIAFGKDMNRSIFDLVSYEDYLPVDSASALPKTFAEVFAKTLDSRAVETTPKGSFHEFELSADAVGLNIVAVTAKGATVDLRIQAPKGQLTLNAEDPDDYLAKDESYTVMKVGPATLARYSGKKGGTWQIQTGKGVTQLLVIPAYAYHLEARLGAFDPATKSGEVTSIRLVDQDGATHWEKGMKFFAQIDGPGKRYTYNFGQETEPGVYNGSIPFKDSGSYTFRLIATLPRGLTKDTETLRFSYQDNFQFAQAMETPTLEPHNPGKAFVYEVSASSTGNMSPLGEAFTAELDAASQKAGLSLLKTSLTFGGKEPDPLVLRSRRGFVAGLLGGTKPGQYPATVTLRHSSGSSSVIPLQLDVATPDPFYAFWPLAMGLFVLILTVLGIWKVTSYVAFPRDVWLHCAPEGISSIALSKHPSNRWLTGRTASCDIGSDYVIAAKSKFSKEFTYKLKYGKNQPNDSTDNTLGSYFCNNFFIFNNSYYAITTEEFYIFNNSLTELTKKIINIEIIINENLSTNQSLSDPAKDQQGGFQ